LDEEELQNLASLGWYVDENVNNWKMEENSWRKDMDL
jgi:hypothetical protein